MFLVGSVANFLPYALVGIISLVLMIKGTPKAGEVSDAELDNILNIEQSSEETSSQDFHFDDYLAEFHNSFSFDVFSLSDLNFHPTEKLILVAKKPTSRGPPTC